MPDLIATQYQFPSPFSICEDQWDQTVERIPGVLRFDWDTLPYLATILGRFDARDPYVTCPSYHAFTGRKGLWGYAKGRSILLFARNPNKPDQVMFYPQLGNPFPNLAFEFMHKAPVPSGGYQFSRVETEHADFLAASMNKKSSDFYYEVETEKLLDWAFPVHTISTKAVLNPSGKRFKSFRQPINIFPKDRVEVRPLAPSCAVQELMDVIVPWAFKRADLGAPRELIETNVSFLKLMNHSGLDLQGLKFYLDGELTAFEAWAMPLEKKKIVNNFAGFSKSNIRGFSEFQHYTICRVLHEQGIERICLGGSEGAGLDSFKRKMNPVESVELATIAVKPKQFSS